MYQTRSEETGLIQHGTLREAIQAAASDPTIWKLSFTSEDGSRIRLVRIENHPNGWSVSTMADELCQD